MNLGMKLLHLFDCGQVHLGRSKVIPVLNMLYVKTELSYKTDVLHMDRLPKKQQFDLSISSILTAWFLRFSPNMFLANQFA